MKHIIEKHEAVTRIELCNGKEVQVYSRVESRDYPALISDLEAEWCKAMEWVEATYSQFGEGKWQNWGAVDDTMYTTAELLKIYQNKEK